MMAVSDTSNILGPVECLWRATSDNCTSNTTRNLWIWIHPSFYATYFEFIQNQVKTKFLNEIQVESSRKDYFRFELLGPLCNTTLKKIVCNSEEKDNFKVDFISPSIQTSSLPSNVVFSLKIRDPRYFRRLEIVKRQQEIEIIKDKNKTEVKESKTFSSTKQGINQNGQIPSWLLSWNHEWAFSDLWDKEKKEELACHVSEKEFCSFLPLEKLDLPTVVNLLFMKSDTIGEFGSGLTIIGPISWAKPVWKSLIMAGARAIGLEEKKDISFNSFKPHFPNDYPETISGQTEAKRLGNILEEAWTKAPKAKRYNFAKLGIQDPFLIPWNSLFLNEKEIKFLRSKSIFMQLKNQFIQTQTLPEEYCNSLICVWVSLAQQGTLLKNMARIYEAPLPLHKKKQKKFENQKLIGFVNTGGYDLLTGLCKGFAYVKVEDVLKMSFDRDETYRVLLKNVGSQWLLECSLKIAFY